jgi:hypothetical protein
MAMQMITEKLELGAISPIRCSWRGTVLTTRDFYWHPIYACICERTWLVAEKWLLYRVRKTSSVDFNETLVTLRLGSIFLCSEPNADHLKMCHSSGIWERQ